MKYTCPALEGSRKVCKNIVIMKHSFSRSLLPAGLQDLLPPEAATESYLGNTLLDTFKSYGYERVKPPFIEFEDSLLSGPGAGLSEHSFRLMDPISRRMMALRSDMTPQVGRIATTRLLRAPRPLRLSYGGDVLRVQGSELRPERQFAQVGYELIGSISPHSDAEVVLLSVEALSNLGLSNLTVDLNAPTLVMAVIENLNLSEESELSLRNALDRKDFAGIAKFGGDATSKLSTLLTASGAADSAIQTLLGLDLPDSARRAAASLCEVAQLIMQASPVSKLTIDPVERRGFEYQTGVCFTLFADGVRGELGRGGRYQISSNGSNFEDATGCTLYMDTLLRAVKQYKPEKKVFIPHGTEYSVAECLRKAGWITIAALGSTSEDMIEARRLACDHIYTEAGLVSVQPEE